MTAETMGMIPRAVNQIYAAAERLKPKGWEFQIEGQYLEIYNETLRDLIGSYDPNKKHEIKHTGYGRKTMVTNITTGMCIIL
jgi:kinesin family protein C1